MLTPTPIPASTPALFSTRTKQHTWPWARCFWPADAYPRAPYHEWHTQAHPQPKDLATWDTGRIPTARMGREPRSRKISTLR